MGGRKWLEPKTSGGFQVSLLPFYLRPCLIILEGGCGETLVEWLVR